MTEITKTKYTDHETGRRQKIFIWNMLIKHKHSVTMKNANEINSLKHQTSCSKRFVRTNTGLKHQKNEPHTQPPTLWPNRQIKTPN